MDLKSLAGEPSSSGEPADEVIISSVSARAGPVCGPCRGRETQESVAGASQGRGVVTWNRLRREKGSQINDGGH